MADKSEGAQRAEQNKKDQNEIGGEEAQPKGHPTSDRYNTEAAHAAPDKAAETMPKSGREE